MWNGFGDGLARAFELVATPAIFGFLGHLLDRRLGVSPLFLVAFLVLAVVWGFAKTWMGYEASMKAQDAAAPWAAAPWAAGHRAEGPSGPASRQERKTEPA